MATAALLLVLLIAGLYTVGPLRPRPTEPMLGAVGDPVQFAVLWEVTSGADAFSRPYGLGIAPDGTLWVANQDRFELFAPDGTYLETWGTPGSAEGEFEFYAPESSYGIDYGDVDFDAEGNIYVLDTGNHRVQKFDPERNFLLAWGSKGDGEGQFWRRRASRWPGRPGLRSRRETPRRPDLRQRGDVPRRIRRGGFR